MVCPKCKQDAELKVFQTFQFYYCKKCKEEVKLEEIKSGYHNWRVTCNNPGCEICQWRNGL